MNIRKKALWRVPLICIVAGIISSISILLFARFTIVTLPDGVVTTDNFRVLIIYGVLFFATLFIGGLRFCRHMTRKELFASASIMVLYGIILLIVQQVSQELIVQQGSQAGASILVGLTIYLFLPFEWCGLISQLLIQLGIGVLPAVVISMFTPYLFVLFGRKESIDQEEEPSSIGYEEKA